MFNLGFVSKPGPRTKLRLNSADFLLFSPTFLVAYTNRIETTFSGTHLSIIWLTIGTHILDEDVFRMFNLYQYVLIHIKHSFRFSSTSVVREALVSTISLPRRTSKNIEAVRERD